METIIAWLSTRKDPRHKETKNGNAVLEVYGTVQTEAYNAWLSNGRAGDAPDRYLYVTFSVFEPQIEHVLKIIEKAKAKQGDPRADALLIGRWTGTREYEGKTYANFYVNEASPLLYGPLSQRGS